MIIIYLIIIRITVNTQQIYLKDPPHTALLTYDNKYGYYLVNLKIGQQIQSLIIDTGSGITAVDCYEKQNHYYPQYKPSKYYLSCMEFCSFCSFFTNQCRFNNNYVDGSYIKGYYVKDYLLFGDDLTESYFSTISIIGCINNANKGFKQQPANGILGLSPNSNTFPDVVDDIHLKESITQSFSICLSNNTGYMSIGGYDYFRHQTNQPIFTINYTSPDNYYKVILQKLVINNITVINKKQLNEGYGVILDTGSTLINTNKQQYQKIISQYEGLLKYQDWHCLIDQNKSLANLVFKFDEFDYEWNINKYLLDIDDQRCLPIGIIGGKARFILGSVWMQDLDILFDRSNTQISFYQQNCSIGFVESDLTEQQIRDAVSSQQELIDEFEYPYGKWLLVFVPLLILIVLGVYLVRRLQLKKRKEQQLLI